MAQTNNEYELTVSQLKRVNKKLLKNFELVWEAYLVAHPEITRLWEIKINDVLAWLSDQCNNPNVDKSALAAAKGVAATALELLENSNEPGFVHKVGDKKKK